MAVRIQIGEDEWRCHASFIVDCLGDLVHSALELTESRPARPVIFFEEPNASRLSFEDSGELVGVKITQHPDLKAAQNALNGTVAMSAMVTRAALTRAIWSAARRLEGICDHEKIESEWRAPFPVKALEQLGERLA